MEPSSGQASLPVSGVASRDARSLLGGRVQEAARHAVDIALKAKGTPEIAHGQFTFQGILLAFSSRVTKAGKIRVHLERGLRGVPDVMVTEREFRNREREGIERQKETRRMGGPRLVRV